MTQATRVRRKGFVAPEEEREAEREAGTEEACEWHDGPKVKGLFSPLCAINMTAAAAAPNGACSRCLHSSSSSSRVRPPSDHIQKH